jgi:regulator of cell morphogenesis and NO signaling
VAGPLRALSRGVLTDTLRNETVASIVARFPATARVFQSHRIDFCCRGDVTVEEALAGREPGAGELLAEVEGAIRAPAAAADPSALDLPVAALVARIIDRHHGYLRRALPAAAPLVERIAEVHGAKDAALPALHAEFVALRVALERHADDEEHGLFPLLMSREPDRALAAAELARMRAEHEEIGRRIRAIREYAHDYASPEWACRTYRLAMAELEDLETDLLRHIHLENHVLAAAFRDDR